MAVPYVCAACRSKLVRPSLKAAHSISRTSLRCQSNSARDDIDALLELPNRRRQYTKAEPELPTSRYSNDNGRLRGRYSGKELRPEQLLSELGQPVGTHVNGESTRRTSRGIRMPLENEPIYEQNDRQYMKPGVRISALAYRLAKQLVAQVNNDDFRASWQTLQELGEECQDVGASEARVIFRMDGMNPALAKLLRKATTQWLEGLVGTKHEVELPTALDITKILLRLRATVCELYRPTLWHTAAGIFDLQSSNKFDEQANGTLQSAVGLLTQLWRICMATQIFVSGKDLKPTTASVLADETDWNFLPAPDTFLTRTSEVRDNRSFEAMFNLLVPVQKNPQMTVRDGEYVSAALITHDLLNQVKSQSVDGQVIPLSQLPEHAPFARLLEAMLKAAPAPRVPRRLFFKMTSLEDVGLLGKYQSMIARLGLYDNIPFGRTKEARQITDIARERAFPLDGNDQASEEPIRSNNDVEFAQKPQTPQIESFALLNVKRLGKALEARDMYQAEKIRREVYAFAGSHQDDPRAVPLELYEHLVLTFLSLQNPKAAIEIWNHIANLGYQPTVKTYSVMMRGARTSRDCDGMEAFWHKMRQSGLQPDEYAWSIRIYGLFGLDRARQGMEALNEMGREWFAAAKAKATQGFSPAQRKQFAARNDLFAEFSSTYPSAVDGVPRPNVVIMNSAISSLAHKRDYIITDVLRWGRTFGIDPDLTTYNALLNVSMRKGEAPEAMNILHSMQKRGIHGDSTTWTVLLTALFQGGFLDGLDHVAQQKKILNFVNALESKNSAISGLDEKGYALIINNLLKQYSNATAADAIMARMIDVGRQPTCYIYTILLSHYFDTQPEPDLAAVQALWRHIESANRGWSAVLDNVFYDRMIEGYARHHHLAGIQPALGFLKRARQAGQRTGWVALEAVSRALAERQQWDRLRALVDQIKVDVRENRGGTGPGQRSFWRFVEQTGLFAGEEVDGVGTQMKATYPREGPLMRAAASAAEGAWSRGLAN